MRTALWKVKSKMQEISKVISGVPVVCVDGLIQMKKKLGRKMTRVLNRKQNRDFAVTGGLLI